MDKEQETNALLTFLVGPYHFCAPAADVETIISVPAIRAIPFGASSLAGITLYRNQTAIVISMRRKLGLEEQHDKKAGQLILTRLNSGLTAFWVDEALDLISPAGLKWHTLPPHFAGMSINQFITKKDDNKIFLYTPFELIYGMDDSNSQIKTLDTITDTSDQRPSEDDEQPFAPTFISQDEKQLLQEDNSKKDLAETSAGKDRSPGPTKQKSSSPAPPPSSQKITTQKVHNDQKQEIKKENKKETKNNSVPIDQPPPGKQSCKRQDQKIEHKQQTASPQKIILIGAILSALLLFIIIWRHQPITPTKEITSKKSRAPTMATSPAAIPGDLPIDTKNAPGRKIPPQAADKKPARGPVTTKRPSQKSNQEETDRGETKADKKIVKVKSNDFRPAFEGPQRTKAQQTTTNEILGPNANKKILMVENDKFTLTIERPQGTKAEQTAANEILEANTDKEILIEENDKFTPATEGPPGAKAKQRTVNENFVKPTMKRDRPVEVRHIVVKGDTLWHIAKRYLGNPLKYPKLAELSRINDPDLIYPGDIIHIVINTN